MGDLKDKAISGVKWNAIGRFSTQGVNFIIGLILARLLSPSDYGVVGMVGIFFAIAQTFIDSGFGSALIRKNDVTDTDYSTAFYFNILVGLVCCILLCVASPFIANFFNTPILKDLVKVMSLNMLIGSLAVVHTTKLTHHVDFRSQSIINLFTAIISGVVGLMMAYKGFYRTIFPENHSLSLFGEKDDFDKLTAQDVREFYKKFQKKYCTNKKNSDKIQNNTYNQ